MKVPFAYFLSFSGLRFWHWPVILFSDCVCTNLNEKSSEPALQDGQKTLYITDYFKMHDQIYILHCIEESALPSVRHRNHQ